MFVCVWHRRTLSPVRSRLPKALPVQIAACMLCRPHGGFNTTPWVSSPLRGGQGDANISLNLAVNPNVLAAMPGAVLRGCRGGGLGWDNFNEPQARRPHPNTQLCKGRSESKPHSQAFHKHTLIIFIKNFNTERAACQEMHLHCQLQREIALRRCSIPETPSPPPSLSFLLLPFLPFVGPWCW